MPEKENNKFPKYLQKQLCALDQHPSMSGQNRPIQVKIYVRHFKIRADQVTRILMQI